MNTRIWLGLSLVLASCTSDLRGTREDESTDTGGATVETNGAPISGDDDDGENGSVPGDNAPTPSPAPAPPVFEGDPERMGELKIVHDSNGITIPHPGKAEINAGLFVPSIDGTSMAKGKKFPLVVAHPGFGAQWEMYTELASHLASWGYVVISINHASFGQDHMLNAEQTLATIAWASSDRSPVKDIVDTSRVATAGHSMGGKIALLSAYLDAGEHIKVIIGWDPVTAGGPMATDDPSAVLPDKIKQLDQPYLMFGAAPGNCSPEGGNAQAIFEAADGKTQLIDFPKANHMDWVDLAQSGTIGGFGGSFCGGQSGVPEDVHRITMRTQVAWLKRHLEGLQVDEAFFDPKGSMLGADVASGLCIISLR